MSCAFRDCGRPDCPACALGRVQHQASASTHEPMRDNAPAELKEKRKPSPSRPKRRHRVGPHR